ncbi:OmpA family protein [Brevundimonas sp. NIBR11]|uniref:OmpA family protein n=1 Tax=Brevundimonas sp. NIBR11 TaxID=3015999 RepID=UPI0022F02262|nr:OmpA family protein [Brevundimonas sp. NIBR11]WGM32767.1 Peptidoglycan-associated lipoprotein [Brevundimonas sp. NIBR11]
MTMRSMIWAAGLASVTLAGCSTMGTPSREALVAEPSTCAAKRFDIYFAEDQAQLTDAARTAIGLTASQLQGCQIRTVRVLGLSSATGTADANQALSEQRAIAVAEALVAAGWPTPAFELAAAGDQGATTPSGVAEPLRRRTEVLVDAAPL